jgi:thiamine transport system permease protein
VVVGLLALAGRTRPGSCASDDRVERVDRRTAVRRPRRADLPAAAVTALVLALVAAPVAALLVRSLRVAGPGGAGGRWSLDNYRALTGTGPDDALLVPVTTALSNSLRVAVDATVLALVLGLVVSVLVTRPVRSAGGGRLLRLFGGVFMLPLGVSAVTVGFGFLVTLDSPPVDFRGSPWLVPVAQAMVALPLVIRTVSPALRGIDPRQREAAATLCAGPLRVLTSVELPVAWRPVLAAGGFAFAVSLGEFGATSFLARPDRPTLPVVVFELIGRPGAENFGMALAASVVLATVTAGVMVGVERLRVGSVGAF